MGNSSSSTEEQKAPDYSKNEHLLLNVYVPQKGQSSVMGMGIYHSGVEMFGVEYCFNGGDTSSTGVCSQVPHVAPPGSDWKYDKTVDLGPINCNKDAAMRMLEETKKDFAANTYHLVARNCNNFSGCIAERLGCSVPTWLNRAAEMGRGFMNVPPNVVAANLQTSQRTEELKKVAAAGTSVAFQKSKGHKLADGPAEPVRNPWKDMKAPPARPTSATMASSTTVAASSASASSGSS